MIQYDACYGVLRWVLGELVSMAGTCWPDLGTESFESLEEFWSCMNHVGRIEGKASFCCMPRNSASTWGEVFLALVLGHAWWGWSLGAIRGTPNPHTL